MILGKRSTWSTILFYVFISILYMFRVTSCSSSGVSIVSIQRLIYVTLFRKRSPTQSDIYQMWYWYNWYSWWWARGYSKHVENWNKYIEKNCASIWSFSKNQETSVCIESYFISTCIWSELSDIHKTATENFPTKCPESLKETCE